MLGTSKNIWGFDPRSVPGCQLWLDGADTSSMTFSGSSITQWNDKSGNGYNATSTGTPTITTVNGRSSVSFNGSSYFIRSNFTGLFNSSYVSWIAVANVTNSASASYLSVVGTSYAINNYSENQLYINSGNIFLYYRGYNGDPARTDTVSLTSGTNILQTITDFRDGSYQIYQNGTGYTIRGGGPLSLSTSEPINLTIGHDLYPGDTILVGSISEILLYTQPLTTSQRQQVEGYLSHKWGLNGYYDSSIPLSIPGCQLWLDGADPAGTGVTPSNGATVSTWVDKSGNGRNATTLAGTPTFALTPSRVTFNGSSWYSTTLSSVPTTETIFLVSSTTSDIAGGQGQIGCTTSNFGGRGLFQANSEMRYTSFGVANRASNGNGFVNGSIFITDVVFEGTNSQVFINGVGGTVNTTTSFSGSGTTLIGSLGGATQPFFGSIYEVIIFNAALTTSQRQQVEGYLARKWGLTSMYSALPSIHPFSSIRPHLRTFQPTDIPGCQLWLDGADQSSLVLSGSNVTQWNDKSGNGRNGTLFQNYPTYTTNRVNFNGTQGLATSLSPSTNIESGFVICGFTSVSSVNTLIGSFVSENGGRQFRVYNAIQTIKQDIVAVLTSGTSLENNTTYLCEYVNNGTTLTHYLNGNSYASGGSVTYTAGGNITSIGYRSNNNGYNEGLYGYIQEVLIFNTALTTSQRQQIEGYLAHKWGLTPYLPVISPLSIPGCQLWLDGADPAGTSVTPSNGAAVSTWVDKSGNGNNAAASGTMTIGTLNNIPAIVFPAASTAVFLPPASLSVGTNGYSVFFVANQTSFASGGTRIYSANSGGVQSFIDNGPSPRILSLYNGSSISSTFTVVANTPFLYSYTISSSAGGLWKNGTLAGSSGGSTTAISTFNIGNYVADPLFAFTGQMGEFIIFNSALTTTQRQSIEGYLARKWGISISATLPSPHPFKSISPASLPFSPRNISTLALWLDGADSSQVTFSSSSNVNTWIDKSGFNNSSSNQSLGSTITYPGTKVNGLNTVNFTAGCIRGAFNGSSVINTTDVTIFIVTAETAPNDNLRMFSLTPAANYQDDQASNMLIYCAPGNYQLTFYRGGAMPTPYTVTQNVPFIYSLTQTSGTGSMWLNGGSNRTASITTSAFAVTNYNIGTQYLANQNYTGLMCEIVVYNTLLNTSQRQQVEGYLAQKWGLITLLPSTHPYVKLPA